MTVYAVIDFGDWQGGKSSTLYGVYSTEELARQRISALKADPDSWATDLAIVDVAIDSDVSEPL